MKKAARPATPTAHSTATVTSSLARGFLPSKARKNGTIASSSTKSEIREYFLPSKYTSPKSTGSFEGKQVEMKLRFDLREFASFDDLGKIAECAFLLEQGEYTVHVG